MSTTIYFHIGPPKTASTYLQENFLARLESIDCSINPKVEVEGEKIKFSDLFLLSPGIWERVGRDVISELSEPARAEGKDLVISSEGIFGGVATPRPWYRGRQLRSLTNKMNALRRTNGLPHHYSFEAHFDKIRNVSSKIGIDEVKVVMNIRRQDTKMASEYTEMSSFIDGASQVHFEKWVDKVLSGVVWYYGLGGEKLNYFEWWKRVSKKIGRKNILLLPMEFLKENNERFLMRWASFLGVENDQHTLEVVNSAVDERKRASSTLGNTWFLRPPARNIKSLPFRILRKAGLLKIVKDYTSIVERDRKIRLTDEISKKIIQKFSKSNRMIDDKIENISIEKYNYY